MTLKKVLILILLVLQILQKHVPKKIKLIYLSTSYVYPGTKGNYNETDALLPFNNYAWSKLGGEAAVQMYKKFINTEVEYDRKTFLYTKKLLRM